LLIGFFLQKKYTFLVFLQNNETKLIRNFYKLKINKIFNEIFYTKKTKNFIQERKYKIKITLINYVWFILLKSVLKNINIFVSYYIYTS